MVVLLYVFDSELFVGRGNKKEGDRKCKLVVAFRWMFIQ